jgi:hypothetical protein
VVLALSLCACTGDPIAAGVPRIVPRVVIAPYAMHEECLRLSPGDRIDYRYESSAALDFNIHYHESNAVLAPVVRERSTADSGTFEASIAHDYCLTWEAGPPGAIIGYRIMLRRGAP